MVSQRDSLLTATEAADFLGLSLATIRKMTTDKEFPVVHPTGKRAVRYRQRDLEDLVRMRSTPMRRAGT